MRATNLRSKKELKKIFSNLITNSKTFEDCIFCKLRNKFVHPISPVLPLAICIMHQNLWKFEPYNPDMIDRFNELLHEISELEKFN